MGSLRSLVAACVAVCATASLAFAEDTPIFGDWHTENRDSTVHLYSCGEALCGVIVAIDTPSDVDPLSVLDTHNIAPHLYADGW